MINLAERMVERYKDEIEALRQDDGMICVNKVPSVFQLHLADFMMSKGYKVRDGSDGGTYMEEAHWNEFLKHFVKIE